MKPIKLIITDLDATLLNDQKNISDCTYQIIMKAREQGIKFVPATARALRVLKRMNMVDRIPHDLLACLNGAMIYDEHDRVIYHKGLSKADFDLFIDALLMQFADSRITIEMNEEVYANHNVWEVDPHEKNYVVCDLKHLPNKMIERIVLDLKKEEDMQKLRDILPDYMYAHRIEGTLLCRILHKEVSKAHAIEYLCQLWNIDIDEVVVFGDDENDLEMFRLCPNAVAMENAIDELKALASSVTKSNNEDGVAYWIENNIKLD